MGRKFLVVEDLDFFRDQLKDHCVMKEYAHTETPDDLWECQKTVESEKFMGALIDYNLSEWLEGDQKFIKLGEMECYTGIDVALYLRETFPEIRVGLYSSNKKALIEAYKEHLHLYEDPYVSLVLESNKDEDVNQHLHDFMEEFYSLEFKILPIHEAQTKLPREVQLYFSKKLAKTRNFGEYVWSIGPFAWLVAVNSDHTKHVDEIIKRKSKKTFENKMLHYLVKLDTKEFTARRVIDKSISQEVDIEAISCGAQTLVLPLEKEDPRQLAFELFIVHSVCEKFLSGELNINYTIKSLKELGFLAKLESQKILFRNLYKKKGLNIQAKEDIHAFLGIFEQIGFPFVIDLFLGEVLTKNETTTTFKMKNLSPGGSTESMEMDSELASSKHLKKDSSFFYIVFEYEGGSGSFFELI